MTIALMRKPLSTCAAGLAALATATALASLPAAARPVEAEESFTGLVTSIDPLNRTISVKSWWLLPTRKFVLGEGCIFILPSKTPGLFIDLRLGQKIRVSYQPSHDHLIADAVELLPTRFQDTATQNDTKNSRLALHRSSRGQIIQNWK